MSRMSACFVLTVLVACAATGTASAQEPTNSPAATQPSTGRWVLRSRLRYLDAREHPDSGDRSFQQWTNNLSLAYGLSGDLSIAALLPVHHRTFRDGDSGERDREFGVGDVTMQLKWRIYQNDFGPIDTSRFSLIAGVQVPSFDRPFSSESVNPMFGGVFTHVQGRHGFNASGIFKVNTGSGTSANLGGGAGNANALLYDSSYVFRISPKSYTADTHGALYGLLELNGIYETNGDNELLLAPGIMYEARTWTVEASIQLPIWQDVDRRPETRFAAVLGVRFLF